MLSVKVKKLQEKAKKCASVKQYGLALGNYLMLCKLDPTSGSSYSNEISKCLGKCAKQLEASGRHGELLKVYESTLEVLPTSGLLLNHFGEYLLRHGHVLQSTGYFQRALLADDCPVARAGDNLDRATATLVDRWHFTMLNDRVRNETFNRSIAEAVKSLSSGALVLDVGAGTGLLSMMAVRAGADSVVACESSDAMAQICAATLADNHMTGWVKLASKSSLELSVGDGQDLPRRASLLITETFDAGLLGEHILGTLDHAWRHLLLPAGRVLPYGAKVCACAVQSSYLRHEHLATNREGRLICRSMPQNEPYDSERIDCIPGGYVALTDSVEIYRVDFNDPAHIRAGLEGQVTDHVTKCTVSGRVDALVTWFDLDMGIEIDVLSSAPGTGSCWEQAIYPVYSGLTVCAGDSLTVRATCKGHLSLQLVHHLAANTTLACSSAGDQPDLSWAQTKSGLIPAVSDGEFYFTSNEPLVEWLQQQFEAWKDKQSPGSAPHRCLKVLDLCPAAVVTLAEAPCEGSMPLEQESGDVMVPQRPSAAGELDADPGGVGSGSGGVVVHHWPSAAGEESVTSADEPWDVVLSWPVWTSGRLDPTVLQTLQRVRVAAGGRLLPAALQIRAVAVSSDLVRHMAAVDAANTAALDCSALNLLSTRHLESFPYFHEYHATNLSEVSCIGQLDLASGRIVPQAAFSLPVISGGALDGLVYWFQPVDGSQMLVTGGGSCKQMVAVCRPQRTVEAGDAVRGRVHGVSDGVFIQLEM